MHPDEDSKLPYTPLPRSLTEDIGEDPARWLDGPLAPLPRIRGLRSIKRVRGWQAAERLLASRQDRDPRERIMAALDEREAYLESIDEEPAQREIRDDRDVTWYRGDVPFDEVDRSGALESLQRPQSRAVATDGGEDREE